MCNMMTVVNHNLLNTLSLLREISGAHITGTHNKIGNYIRGDHYSQAFHFEYF